MSAIPVQTRPEQVSAIAPSTPRVVPAAGATVSAGPDRLQQLRVGASTVRQHLQRALIRVTVLLLADLSTIYVVRAIGRWVVRDSPALGTGVTPLVDRVFPLGLLEGWQFATAMLISLLVFGTYRAGDPRRDARRIFGAAALATALTLWATMWDRGLTVVLVQYLALAIGFGVALAAQRISVDWVTGVLFPERRVVTSRALIVGLPHERKALLASAALRDSSELRVVGWLDPVTLPDRAANGGLADLDRLLGELKVESVIVADSIDTETFAAIADRAMASGCELLFAPRGLDLPGAKPRVVWRRGHALLQLTAPGMLGWQRVLKRVMDVAGALAGVIVFSPLLATVALLVKLDSPGPVFFRQERVGQGGRRFGILKFRTMVAGAESQREALSAQSVYDDPRLFKLRSDPRVTRVGAVLRKWSLDEMPQLFNVLRGHMSLVGPRPPLPSEVELYEERHFARFEVKPGMTGPWQVNGRNEITDFEKVVELEAAYIRQWSLADDIVLLIRTVPAVLNRRGAY